jgi:hypothetical protein
LEQLLLQAIYGIRSEQMLIEHLGYNLIFPLVCRPQPGWSRLAFHHIWPPADRVHTKNRDQLLNEELMVRFLELLMASTEDQPLLSSEHFSVDVTLLRAWASHISLERTDGSDDKPAAPSGGNVFRAAPGKGKSEPREISTACCSPTTRTAPASWPAAMVWWLPVRLRQRMTTGSGRRPCGWCVLCRALTRRRWERTRATTPEILSPSSTLQATRLMWRRTLGLVVVQPLTAVPPAIWATPSRSTRGRGSSSCLAGSNRPQGLDKSQVGAVFRLHVVAYNLIRLVNLLSSREALAWHRGPRLIGVGSIISD